MADLVLAGMNPESVVKLLRGLVTELKQGVKSELVDAFVGAYTQEYLRLNYQAALERSRFGKDAGGGKWKKLQDPNREARLGILDVTGRLLDSAAPGKMIGTEYVPPEEQEFRHVGNKVTVSSSVPYFQYHQKGTRFIPKRPVFAGTPAQRKEWKKRAQGFAIDYVLRIVSRNPRKYIVRYGL